MNVLANLRQTLNAVRKETDRVLLFYSGGKDSLLLLHECAATFTEVVCVFMYFAPGLKHIDRYLSYATTKYPNVRLLQVPHWQLSQVKKYGVYCRREPKTKLLKLADIDNQVRLATGLTHTIYGMKKADSLTRRIWLNDTESKHPDRLCIETTNNRVYPLANWKKGEVIRYLEHYRMPKPISYGVNASSGVGFNLPCYLYLRTHFPEDLAVLLNLYPASEEILFKYDNQTDQIPEISGGNDSPQPDSERAL